MPADPGIRSVPRVCWRAQRSAAAGAWPMVFDRRSDRRLARDKATHPG
jgi:hypothetical protein